MNFNIGTVFVLVLVFRSIDGVLTTNTNDNSTEYCGYELLTNLEGKAYTSEDVGTVAANKSLQLIFERMMHEHNVEEFKLLFGLDLENVLSTVKWYYRFEAVGHVRPSSTLPKSFRCIYGNDVWDLPLNQSSAKELDFLTSTFYSFAFLNRLKDQIPSQFPLPIFIGNGLPNYKVWVNFANAMYNDTEFFIIVLYMENDGKRFLVIQLKDKKSNIPILM